MAKNSEVEAAGEKSNTTSTFSLKNRKPAYFAAAVILIVLLITYLLNVYHNRHESKAPLPPKTMTKPTQ